MEGPLQEVPRGLVSFTSLPRETFPRGPCADPGTTRGQGHTLTWGWCRFPQGQGISTGLAAYHTSTGFGSRGNVCQSNACHSFFFFFSFQDLICGIWKFARGRLRAVAAGYTTATATQDQSLICDPHHSSRQRQILNPLSEARLEPTSSWILVRFLMC